MQNWIPRSGTLCSENRRHIIRTEKSGQPATRPYWIAPRNCGAWKLLMRKPWGIIIKDTLGSQDMQWQLFYGHTVSATGSSECSRCSPRSNYSLTSTSTPEERCIQSCEYHGRMLPGPGGRSASEIWRTSIWRSLNGELMRFFKNWYFRVALGAYAMYTGAGIPVLECPWSS